MGLEDALATRAAGLRAEDDFAKLVAVGKDAASRLLSAKVRPGREVVIHKIERGFVHLKKIKLDDVWRVSTPDELFLTCDGSLLTTYFWRTERYGIHEPPQTNDFLIKRIQPTTAPPVLIRKSGEIREYVGASFGYSHIQSCIIDFFEKHGLLREESSPMKSALAI